MSLLDIFRVGKFKADLEATRRERDSLKSIVAETDRMDYQQLKAAISDLRDQKLRAEAELKIAHETNEQTKEKDRGEIRQLEAELETKRKEVIVLDDEILLQSFGLYKPRYDLQTSDAYRAKLEGGRLSQQIMVKEGRAATCPAGWTLNGSKTEGARMVRDYTKLIVRSFNNECDASIVRVKFNNVESIEQKIVKAFDTLNKLAQRMSISISRKYLDLKLDELHLAQEYEVKKQQEKEEQKQIREQMREEARLMEEIEEKKQKLEKEERHFAKALDTISEQIQKVSTDAERVALEGERAMCLSKIEELGHVREEIHYREQNTRAGYVYVISNIGAFGESIYKIGVTRRFDPAERVYELGDASVPFRFDIHATIFSDDAPGLENALHKAFADRRLNRINLRREFFHVTLEEIEMVVKQNFNKPIEVTRLAEASEFRQSQAMAKAASSVLPRITQAPTL